MKRTITAIAFVLILSVSEASAQNYQTSYFLDNYLYSYRINPAQGNDKSFFGFVINNLSLTENGNVGIGNFLYPTENGKLVTGLNRSISPARFLDNLPDATGLGLHLNESLFACGTQIGKAYTTLEINLKANVLASVPKDLMTFLKSGTNGNTYNFDKLHIGADSYAEIALGYSRDINNMVRVGGRLKALVGLASVHANFSKAEMTLTRSSLHVTTTAELSSAADLLRFGTDEDGYLDFSPEIGTIGVAGFGAAVDLGVSVKPVKGLNVTASVTDLGGISWKKGVYATSSVDAVYEGVDEIHINENIGDDFEDVLDDFEDITKFTIQENSGKSFKSLPCTVNLGARYQMPFYDRLSVGILGTFHFDRYNPYNNVRFGATITPVKFVSLTGNAGVGTFGPVAGAALCLNLPVIHITIGADTFLGKYGTIQDIPVPINPHTLQLNLGVNIAFRKV